jgi:hypothetical protein
VVEKRKKVDENSDDIVPDSKEEIPQEPKAKRVKVKV